MSLLARNRRKASKQTGAKIAVTLFGISMFFLMILGVALAIGMTVVNGWLQDLPDYTAEGAFDVMEPTSIFSADGVLLAKLYLQNREIVPIEEMSPWILKGIVAVEDERYYEHQGVDPQSVVRAAVTGYGGGSSISQQYIRQTVLIDEAQDQTYKRKIREMFLALELEKRYTKEEILSMYLNSVYFGNGAYGIEAASKNIFAKKCSELNIAEAALLAALPNQPAYLNPLENPDALDDLIARRDLVLERMLTNELITKEEHDAAIKYEYTFESLPMPSDGIYAADYFVDMVKRQLDELFDFSAVFGGGMTVITTLNYEQQGYAEQAVWNALPGDGLQGALVAIEPPTGYVRALVGGTDYDNDKFNLATQAYRHPGSSMKTFTLLTALNEGMSPETPVDCRSPITLDNNGDPWRVENAEGGSAGVMSLRSATAWSYNTAFALLIDKLGADKVVEMAHAAGIKTELEPYNSLTLGAQGVTVLEMASAYATIANSGIYNEPTFITVVKNRRGVDIWEHIPNPQQTIDPKVAYACTQVLMGDILNGTAAAANLDGRPVAGKTGTSENYGNVYFVGYTMELATAIWVGYPDDNNRTIVYQGGVAYGGVVCAPIFRAFMLPALAAFEYQEFPYFDAPPYDNSKFAAIKSKEGIAADAKKAEDDARLKAEEEAKKAAEDAAKKAAADAAKKEEQNKPPEVIVEPQPEPDPQPDPPPTPPPNTGGGGGSGN
ncbi:MAG: transglycosylase domain-containing protein [Coriobacteriia bacterium]|nr:transglycosylase domain-containing protein [Coriobacteriia bacterium]